MMKKIFLTLVVITTLLSTALIINPYKISAYNSGNEIKPMAEIFHCDGPSKDVKVLSKNNSEIHHKTNRFATPGSTITVSESNSYSVSNSAGLTIIPNFLSMGYNETVSETLSFGWSKANKTNKNLQLVVLRMYDTIQVTTYSQQSPGTCKLTGKQTVKVYTGFAYDLR